jgi:hypothetical protein
MDSINFRSIGFILSAFPESKIVHLKEMLALPAGQYTSIILVMQEIDGLTI